LSFHGRTLPAPGSGLAGSPWRRVLPCRRHQSVGGTRAPARPRLRRRTPRHGRTLRLPGGDLPLCAHPARVKGSRGRPVPPLGRIVPHGTIATKKRILKRVRWFPLRASREPIFCHEPSRKPQKPFPRPPP